jgi:hypothetical protein
MPRSPANRKALDQDRQLKAALRVIREMHLIEHKGLHLQ